jgi:glycerol-1-phosphate dehydrogenase [NAD(P)+]
MPEQAERDLMSKFLHAQYMDGFGTDGRKHCSCGQVHVLETREILLGDGVAAAIPERIRRDYGDRTTVWVLSDERTEAAAAAELKRALLRLPVTEAVLSGEPKPQCTLQLAGRLAAQARAAAAGLILSVGGGTLSDLGKLISAELRVPNWAMMTAPSMDAHTSSTSNIKTEAGAIPHPAAPSRRVFCDAAVLLAAPKELFLAGLGDQLAKFLGYLDWRLGSWVFGEAICPEAAEASLQSARLLLRALREADKPPGRVRARLADALLTSGLVIQSLGHSRPAASAEHTAAHFWEIAHFARNPLLALHGTLVGAATAMVYRAYRAFYALLPGLPVDIGARVEELEREPPWQQTLDGEIRPYRAILERAAVGRVPVAQSCRESLSRFASHRPKIQRMAGALLDELGDGLRLLGENGFPFDLAEYGLQPAEALLPFRYIRFLRNRTSTFDLMHLLGVEGEIYQSLPTGMPPPRFGNPGPV